IVRTYERLADIAFLGNNAALTFNATLRALNLAERMGPTPELARGYANMCVAAGLIPRRDLAQNYRHKALQTIEQVKDMPTLGHVLMAISRCAAGSGYWDKAEETLSNVIELFEHGGDWSRKGVGMDVLARAAFHRGEFARSAGLAAQIHTDALRRGDAVQQAWGLLGQVETLLPLGEVEEAIAIAGEAVTLLAESADINSKIRAYGLLATAHLRHNRPDLALQFAGQTAALMDRARPTSSSAFAGYAGVADVYLTLWETGAVDRPNRLPRQARQACKTLGKFARVFPIGAPRDSLYRGRYRWLLKRSTLAHRAWSQSLARAQKLAMPYEQGLAHYQIGRHKPFDDPARTEHLTRARQIFARLTAANDLLLVQRELNL
ncbi:MAG: hypothetical protein ACE5G8_18180, partial [Anaerolineae bacterium]